MNARKYSVTEIESFMDQLVSRNGAERETARKSLVRVGKPAVQHLTHALQHSGSDQFRWEAAKTLGEIGDESGIPVLVSALEDRNHDVAWLAAEALKKFKKIAWLPLLHALIRKGSDSVQLRQGVHHVLRNQQETGFVDLLSRLTKALESGSVPESSAVAAYDIMKRMKG
jgi:HEAT repeat protein